MKFRNGFVLLGLALVISPAFASDAYSNFGPGNSFGTYNAWIVGPWTPAFQFQSNTTGSLTGFTVAMSDYYDYNPDNFTLKLYSDPSGNPSTEGTLLGSWTGTTDGTQWYSATTPVTVAASGVTLQAGSYYWLEATTTGGLTWNFNNTGAQNPMMENGSAYGPYGMNNGAFSVQAQAVPEPSSFAAMAGVLGVGIAFRKRKRA